MIRLLTGIPRRAFARIDALVNRLAGSRFNPLYQSGTIAVGLSVVLLVTGLYLVLFYRIGDPHGSVARITEQTFSGRWIRSLHRYASDMALIAIGVHALRMFFQRRAWGPRALAWISGLGLLSIFLIAGWTGFVMVWDEHGRWMAIEGARLMDALPLFSEPLERTFVGERPIPSAFFFVNLFLHVALPVGVIFVLWVHVSRLARPRLLPPRGLWVGGLALLLLAAIALPMGPGAPADPFVRQPSVPLNLFYGFWVPIARSFPAGLTLAGLACAAGAALLVPIWLRPPAARTPPSSWVDPAFCTGCTQCSIDCPYTAISMIAGGRTGLIADVDPESCVSCGICAGSCAPMSVGPPGRTGRDQLTEIRRMIRETPADPGGVVVLGCAQGGAGAAFSRRHPEVCIHSLGCAGNLHTSVIEYLVRAGWGGVMVVACHPRDCWNREGPIWLEERMYRDREAELQARVDRERVALVYAAEGEPARVEEVLAAFLDRVTARGSSPAEDDPEIDLECDPVPPEVALAMEDGE